LRLHEITDTTRENETVLGKGKKMTTTAVIVVLALVAAVLALVFILINHAIHDEIIEAEEWYDVGPKVKEDKND